MAKVEIYRTVNGVKTEKFLALLPQVQASLDEHAGQVAGAARGILAAHRAEGHSYIEVERGRIDRYVVLNDERGDEAAAAIEFGRSGYSRTVTRNGRTFTVHIGPAEGLFVLHQAAGIGGG